jgi:fibronectin type 3 domain-containing protein
MKTKHGLFFGFAVLALTAMFALTGCDNPSSGGGGGGGGGGFDSALVATWHSTQAAADSGDSAAFEFTADGSLTIAGQSDTMTITTTTSGGLISMTYTADGYTLDGGSIKYKINGTTLQFSNPSAGGQIATILNSSQQLVNAMGDGYFHKSSAGGGGSLTPFMGTWTGDGLTLTVTATTWEVEEEYKGTYTYTGNTATLTTTHYWDHGTWALIPPGQASPSTATVSGNTMVGVYDGDSFTLKLKSTLTNSLPAPTGVDASTISSGSIRVYWFPVSGADGYYVYRATSGSGSYAYIGSLPGETFYADTVLCAYDDTELSASTTYYYQVSAYNSSGEGPRSSSSSANTPSAGLPAPSNVLVELKTASSVIVSWDAVSGAKYYSAYEAVGSEETYSLISSTSNTFIHTTGLLPNTTYYYKVCTVKDGNFQEGPLSLPVSVTTPPATPTGVTATAQSSSIIQVSWPPVNGAAGYHVYRSTNNYGNYTQIGDALILSYTDTNLDPSTTYYYQISAYNNTGESVRSSSAYATTQSSGGTGTGDGGSGTGANAFVGTWKASTGNQLIFYANSTVESNWMGTGTYTYSGNTATVKFGSASQSLTISSNKFTFNGVSFSKQ